MGLNMNVSLIGMTAIALMATACTPNHLFTEEQKAVAANPVTPTEPDVEPPPPQEVVEKKGEVQFESLEENRLIYTMFDVSYSMREPLAGTDRYGVASTLLLKLVNNDIKEGSEFALRVFGHGVLASCTTELFVAPGAMSRSQVTSKLTGLTTAKQGNTAITASLRQARQDLRSSSARVKQVVLMTDGEETCDADPESPLAEIQAMADEDPTVRLMIVGFKLDDAALAAKYAAWAKVGRGAYFDARNPAGLDDALKKAILAPTKFEAYQNGTLVMSGDVNTDKFELKEGKYDFKLTSPAKTVWFRDVQVVQGRPVLIKAESL